MVCISYLRALAPYASALTSAPASSRLPLPALPSAVAKSPTLRITSELVLSPRRSASELFLLHVHGGFSVIYHTDRSYHSILRCIPQQRILMPCCSI